MEEQRHLVFSILKGWDFLNPQAKQLIGGNKLKNWSINLDYHFGGYAKINRQLIEFTDIFEPVYTGKMLFGIYDLVRKDYFYVGGNLLPLIPAVCRE